MKAYPRQRYLQAKPLGAGEVWLYQLCGLTTSVYVHFSGASAMQHDFLIAVVEDCCADNVIAHEQAINLYEFIVQHTRVGLLPEHRQQWLTDLAKMDRFREGLTSAAIVGPS